MSEVYLATGEAVLVDQTDFRRVAQHRWFFRGGYAVGSRINGIKTLGMHRFILLAPSGVCVDHINGDRLDNRRENIRLCNYAQNSMNKKSSLTSLSKYKGVHFDIVRDKWRAQIYINGKNRHIGYFDDELSAAQSYNNRAIEEFGVWARTNHV